MDDLSSLVAMLVQTDKFGPFNDADYADLALMGLFACTYKVGEQQKYIDGFVEGAHSRILRRRRWAPHASRTWIVTRR